MLKTKTFLLTMMYAHFAFIPALGSFSPREQMLIDLVKQSIDNAEHDISKLSDAVLAVPGMTSHKIKRFLNNLCSLPGCSYLEIGVWKGGTFTAALFDNKDTITKAVAIDNWSEFDWSGNEEDFKGYCNAFISNINYNFYSHDCFTLDIKNLFEAPVDIYFYDGNHTAESQEKAFTYYDSILAPSFIAIVDDWNHPPVSVGTRAAFEKLGYTILFEKILPARIQGEDRSQWWNGLYVAVIRRNV